MDTIYVIKPLEIMAAARGKFKTYTLFYLGIPLLIISSLLMVIYGEGPFTKAIGLTGVLFFGIGGWLINRETVYKPGKSFPFLRQSKEKIRVITLYCGGACIIFIGLFLLFTFLSPEGTSVSTYYRGIVGIVVIAGFIYYTNKSFEVHENIDFVSSSEMEKIIGVENDEKIQITYQNFDSSNATNIEDGCNIMMVTDKKIYFAYYEQNHWSYVIKKIDELSRIGYTGTEEELFFELVFSDDTIIILHMEIADKLTSNSTLFLKRFLEVLDSVLLGTVDEKISSRRRISINKSPANTELTEKVDEGRNIEIDNRVLQGLKGATQVEAGRVLEF